MAACRTVLPFATVTGVPSMVSVTESIDPRSYPDRRLTLTTPQPGPIVAIDNPFQFDSKSRVS